MSIFDSHPQYKPTAHAIDNWFYDDKGRFRGDDPTLKPHQVHKRIQQLAETGEIVLESGNWRYIRNGRFFMPCVYKPEFKRYFIVTLMWYEMVAGTPERMQSVVRRYLDKEGVLTDVYKPTTESVGSHTH